MVVIRNCGGSVMGWFGWVVVVEVVVVDGWLCVPAVIIDFLPVGHDDVPFRCLGNHFGGGLVSIFFIKGG